MFLHLFKYSFNLFLQRLLLLFVLRDIYLHYGI